MKPLSLAAFALLAFSLSSFAADKKAEQKMAAHKAEGGPDVALMQKVWDAWGTMKPENAASFYSQAPEHTFFDEAPLRYNNWQEYQSGVTALFKDLKSLKLTVNDDARIHRIGDTAWGFATIREEATTNTGKHEMATLRWTVIYEKSSDKWLIAHEHVSVPAQ